MRLAQTIRHKTPTVTRERHPTYRSINVAALFALMFVLCATARPSVAAPPASGAVAWVSDHIVEVHAEADMGAATTGHVLKGDEVRIGQLRSGWRQIVAYRGLLSGWIPESRLAFKRPASVFSGDRPTNRDWGPLTSPTLPDFRTLLAARTRPLPHTGPYKGVAYCGGCHKEGGAPVGRTPLEVWQSTRHSRAFDTLKTPEAAAVGRRWGIDKPWEDGRCLKCHTTGYGADPKDRRAVSNAEGVGCEVCHGPANVSYKSAGPFDVSLVDRREKICVGCHNELSPTFAGFNLELYSQEIAHWRRADETTAVVAVMEAAVTTTAVVTPSPADPAAERRAREAAEAALREEEDRRVAEIAANAAAAAAAAKQPEVLLPPAAPTAPSQPSTAQTPPAGKPAEAGVILLTDNPVGPVRFPHQLHQASLVKDCTICHHKPATYTCRGCHQSNAQPSRELAFHDGAGRGCRTCHRARQGEGFNGPLACKGCHK